MGTTALDAVQRPSGRSFLIDAIKASGCLLIVLHHLAFYGPMSDVVATAWPRVVSWFYDHARLAVQFFLVCSGFLTASSLARFESLTPIQALKLLWQRYLRLAVPLLVALSFTVLVTEWVRPGFAHTSLSATPDWGQALAHIVMLQHVLDLQALSAGIWYVAIDLQLYAMAVFSLWVVKVCHSVHATYSAWTLRWGLWFGLTCASLWWWNLDADLDDFGVYFWGSYGLGLLAWRGRQHISNSVVHPSRQLRLVLTCVLAIDAVAWVLLPRLRVATALGVAVLLIAAPAVWSTPTKHLRSYWRNAVHSLSDVSYSVFLTHFGVSLLISAQVTKYWPASLPMNAAGLLISLGLSVLLGTGLHRWVERQMLDTKHLCLLIATFMTSVALCMMMVTLRQ